MNDDTTNAQHHLEALKAQDDAVTATYYSIINDIKALIKQQSELHRTIIEYTAEVTAITHGLYSKYVIIELNDLNRLYISYAINSSIAFSNELTRSAITRIIKHHTSNEPRREYIESCIEEWPYDIEEYHMTRYLAIDNLHGYTISDNY